MAIVASGALWSRHRAAQGAGWLREGLLAGAWLLLRGRPGPRAGSTALAIAASGALRSRHRAAQGAGWLMRERGCWLVPGCC